MLFTEHINHWVPEAIPPFQVSLASWEPIVPSSSSDLQPHGQPIIDEPIINCAMQEIVQLSDIEQLCENVTQAEKHTEPKIRHDVLIIPSPSLIKTRLLAVNSISMRCFDLYFVARSAMLVSVGCL